MEIPLFLFFFFLFFPPPFHPIKTPPVFPGRRRGKRGRRVDTGRFDSNRRPRFHFSSLPCCGSHAVTLRLYRVTFRIATGLHTGLHKKVRKSWTKFAVLFIDSRMKRMDDPYHGFLRKDGRSVGRSVGGKTGPPDDTSPSTLLALLWNFSRIEANAVPSLTVRRNSSHAV